MWDSVEVRGVKGEQQQVSQGGVVVEVDMDMEIGSEVENF